MPITRRDILKALEQYDLKKTWRRKRLKDHPSITELRQLAQNLPANIASQPLTRDEYFQLANILLNTKIKSNSAFYPCILNPLIGDIAPYLATLKVNNAFTPLSVQQLFLSQKNNIRQSPELITKAAISRNLLEFFKLAENISHALDYLNFEPNVFKRLNEAMPLTLVDIKRIAKVASPTSLYFFLDNYYRDTPIYAAALKDLDILQRFFEDATVRGYLFTTSTAVLDYLNLASVQQTLAAKEILYDLVNEALKSQDQFTAFFAKTNHLALFKNLLPTLAEKIENLAQENLKLKTNLAHVNNQIDLFLSDILQFNTQDVLNDSHRINFILYLMMKSMPRNVASPLQKQGQFAHPLPSIPFDELPEKILLPNEIPNLVHYLDDVKNYKPLPQLMPEVSNADLFMWIDHKLKFRPRRTSASPH